MVFAVPNSISMNSKILYLQAYPKFIFLPPGSDMTDCSVLNGISSKMGRNLQKKEMIRKCQGEPG